MLPSISRVSSTQLISARRLQRFYSTNGGTELRTRLTDSLKTAMKAKDSLASTTLRSVLSEVYAADKVAKDKVPSSTITSILRKAVSQRNEAASKFAQATRQDLADGLLREARFIEDFLPPLLSTTDIDEALHQAIAALPAGTQPQNSRGQIFKTFYQKIDRSTVDTDLVKQRVDALLTEK